MPSMNFPNKTPFDVYDKRIRNILTELALVKPPKGISEKQIKIYLEETIKEFGII